MSHSIRSCFIGQGTLLIQCAQVALAQGHTVAGVISSEREVVRWCEQQGIAHCSPEDDQLAFLSREPFDYLFSIINHAICAAEVLRLPRRLAINFHDSLLPRYAGFNVTSWALLSGETEHGVTWHEMSETVDAGGILKQRSFDIAPDETAFTLAAKCYDAGIASFDELLAELGAGTSRPQAQDSAKRSYFTRQRRPGDGALIAFEQPAAHVARLVRALDFGPELNPFAAAKLVAGRMVARVGAAEVLDKPMTASPGTLLAVEADSLVVATSTAPITLRELQTPEGLPLSVIDFARDAGWEIGRAAPAPQGDLRVRTSATIDALAPHEAYWRRHLLGGAPHAITARAEPRATPVLESRRVEVDASTRAALAALAPSGAGDALIGLFGLWLHRIGDGQAHDVGYRDSEFAKRTEGTCADLWSPQVPLELPVDAQASAATAIAAAAQALHKARERGPFLRDLVGRTPALRAQGASRFPVRVERGAQGDRIAALPFDQLVFVVDPDGDAYSWAFDPEAFAEATITALMHQFAVLLSATVRAPTTPVRELPLIDEQQRRRLLSEWNDTAVAVDTQHCIHDLIDAQIARTPDAIALVFRGRSVSYRELGMRSDELARELRALGVGPDVMVGLCVERSIEMMIGMLGILKAGGAYVPMDPQYPAERLAMMLEDAKAPVLVTTGPLAARLPAHAAALVRLDAPRASLPAGSSQSGVTPEHLAYVIFTSGSTGRPKGVMLRHRNVVNFFAGMDASLQHRHGVSEPGTWLALTSISFDISVLELLWTLARGFKVVIQPEAEKAATDAAPQAHADRRMDFSLFFFSADAHEDAGGYKYRLLIEGAKYADRHGFSAVWTPERHFHAFGGLYPNPSVTSAAIAVLTERLQIRAGSVVLPLHSPLRVAEEWSVVDNLSRGRIGLSFASGWHANDFAFAPENFADRKNVMFRGIETVKKLWRGEAVPARSGNGSEIEVRVLPAPIQKEPPMWITAAGSPETFRMAGQLGANLLTNMLGQKLEDLASKIAVYRAARREAGFAGEGCVSVMLHTFVGDDVAAVRETVRKPFTDYLKTSTELIKQARWEFPAFAKPGGGDAPSQQVDLTAEETDALMAHAFERYFETSGLFGTPTSCLSFVDKLKGIGVDEIACLIDFGVASETVLKHLVQLNALREASNVQAGTASADKAEDESVTAQLRRHGVTHMQCTPSLARMLISEPMGLDALRPLQRLLLGGEALPPSLAAELSSAVQGDVLNMYGPTETTVWSTSARVARPGESNDGVTIGRPIANTEIYLLDRYLQPVPQGMPGELLIGGAGVARGYLDRPEMTAEKFIVHPFSTDLQARLYRTGDLARYRDDGCIEFLGRLDHQIKLRGYRIELGEIEATLGRHPGVREAVAVARKDHSEELSLVAYVVPAQGAELGAVNAAAAWQTLWDETYREGAARQTSDKAADADAAFNIAGWNSSYTGELIEPEQMSEWVERTAERLLALAPRRVVEIGCGTGMLLFRVAPKVEHYCGIDFSAAALRHIESCLDEKLRAKVALRQHAADAIGALPAGSFDLVVINSVAQYFPDIDYFVGVLDEATKLLAPGGRIFVGDVRSLPLLETFHASIEIERALIGDGPIDPVALRAKVDERMRAETELVIDPAFFSAYVARRPLMTDATVRLKRGRFDNEMTRFRYDVVLQRAAEASHQMPTADAVDAVSIEPSALAAEIGTRARTGALRSSGLLNPRLARPLAMQRWLREGGAASTADLRRAFDSAGPDQSALDAFDALWSLDATRDAQIDWAASGDLTRADALFLPRDARHTTPLKVDERPWNAFANSPASAKPSRDALVPSLKAHLRESLPEYMVPAAIVLLDALPLTPNGKVDRKALPAPDRGRAASTVSYTAPKGEIEGVLAGIFGQLLNLDKVGSHDNFFELGANSLLLVRANGLLRQALPMPISLVDMFRFPTVASLAHNLEQRARGADAVDTAIQESQDRAQTRQDAMSRRRQARQGARTSRP